jgi:hypothetical protein
VILPAPPPAPTSSYVIVSPPPLRFEIVRTRRTSTGRTIGLVRLSKPADTSAK